MEIYILRLLHKGSWAQRSFRVYNRATSGSSVSRYNFDDRVSNHYRIRMVEQCLCDSTAFCRVTFPELQRGKRARRTEIQSREGIKAGKTENDSSRILPRRIQTRRGRHTREHTRIPREIRGIPNPITSWPDIVDDSRTDPNGFNH